MPRAFIDKAVIADGIEWLPDHHEALTPSCARCGGGAEFLDCWNCAGEGFSYHDCGEDCCCCIDPEPNVTCDICRGKGGRWHCTNSPAFCQANPIAGREHIESTALSGAAWDD